MLKFKVSRYWNYVLISTDAPIRELVKADFVSEHCNAKNFILNDPWTYRYSEKGRMADFFLGAESTDTKKRFWQAKLDLRLTSADRFEVEAQITEAFPEWRKEADNYNSVIDFLESLKQSTYPKVIQNKIDCRGRRTEKSIKGARDKALDSLKKKTQAFLKTDLRNYFTEEINSIERTLEELVPTGHLKHLILNHVPEFIRINPEMTSKKEKDTLEELNKKKEDIEKTMTDLRKQHSEIGIQLCECENNIILKDFQEEMNTEKDTKKQALLARIITLIEQDTEAGFERWKNKPLRFF